MSTAPPAAAPLKGLAYMIASGVLLTLQDAGVKWLTAEYTTGEIMFWRSLLCFLPMALLIWWAGGPSLLRPRRTGALMLRAALAAGTSLFIVLSFRFLPLPEALAIVFVSPLILTALAGPLLGERVGPRRWSAVLVGFLGMLLIVRPGAGGAALAALAPLAAATLSACRDVVTRKLGPTDPALSILFYSVVFSTLIGFVDMPRGLTPPTAGDLLLLLAIAAAWGLAHLFGILAFNHAEASTISPFKYLSLVWAGLVGYLIWGFLPDFWMLAGALLVVASGLYILHRERLRR